MKKAIASFCLVLAGLVFAPLPAHAGLDKALKPSTKTKTSDDAAKAVVLPEYKGVKHAIGVLNFDNAAGFYSEMTLGDNLRLMLESSLFATGRFVIVERGELGSVMSEQDLQASNRTAKAANVAQTGKIRSARYLATGAITEASTNTSGQGAGIGIKNFRIGGSSSKSAVVVVVKLIDSTTGEVVASERIRGEAGKSALNLGYSNRGVGGDLGAFAKTPLGEAAQDCINQATRFIAGKMESMKIEGSVVALAGEQVVISLGENFGIAPGQVFVCRKDGEVLTDPNSGEVLDRVEGEVTATLEVVKVREKTSYCKLIDGTLPERGHTVIYK